MFVFEYQKETNYCLHSFPNAAKQGRNWNAIICYLCNDDKCEKSTQQLKTQKIEPQHRAKDKDYDL